MQPTTFELDSLPFSTLLDTLRRERSTCIVQVGDGVFRGELRVRDGAVSKASFGTLQGQAALAALAISDGLHYSLELQLEPPSASPGELRPAKRGKETLLGLGAPLSVEPVSARRSRTEILPPPLPMPRAHQVLAPELSSWAERASQQLPAPSKLTVERPLSTQDSAAPPVSAQPSLAPAVFARDRTLWIALALCLPLLFVVFSRVRHSDAPAAASRAVEAAPPAASASQLPLVPPALASTASATLLATPAAGLAPTIVLRVLVAADGSAKTVSVQGPRPGLGQLEKQALEAVRGYRFQPATLAGRPIEAWLTLPVPFQSAPGARVLAVKGSETIGAALGPDWAKRLEQAQPGLKVELDALGSSTGIAGLLDGSADLAMSSRPIRSDELAFATRLGIQLRELIVAYDGIAVIVHPKNPLRSLDVETLARVFAQRVTRWSELAGADAPIRVLGRPTYSGTHAFLRERMLAALGPGGGFGASVDSVETASEIVSRVAQDVNAIGYVSLGQLAPSVRALPLAPSKTEPAVQASAASVRDSSYPVARPLYLYLRADSEHDARALVDFALSSVGQELVAKHGFVPVESPLNRPLVDEIAAPHVTTPEITRLYFQPNSASIEPESRALLSAAISAMRTGKRALVVGHADSTGKADRNELLAQKRADTIARQLRRAARADAVEVEIAAASHPLASNATADGRKANRRVDLLLQDR